ncbi:hypothetical protein MASR2M50_06770 [Thauera sp.]
MADIDAVPMVRATHPLAEARDWNAVADAEWVLNLSAGSQSMNLVGWLRAAGVPGAEPHPALLLALPDPRAWSAATTSSATARRYW